VRAGAAAGKQTNAQCQRERNTECPFRDSLAHGVLPFFEMFFEVRHPKGRLGGRNVSSAVGVIATRCTMAQRQKKGVQKASSG
jgi:hypothetical protein